MKQKTNTVMKRIEKCKNCKCPTLLNNFRSLRYCGNQQCSQYLRDIPKRVMERKAKGSKIQPARAALKWVKDRASKQWIQIPIENKSAPTKKFSDLNPHLYDPVLIKQLKQTLIEVFGEVCMKCGTTEKKILEHIKSRFYGGDNSLENLQLLCFKCNFEKGHKQIDYRNSIDFIAKTKEKLWSKPKRNEKP